MGDINVFCSFALYKYFKTQFETVWALSGQTSQICRKISKKKEMPYRYHYYSLTKR